MRGAAYAKALQLLQLERYEEAKLKFLAVLNEDPSDPIVLSHLAWCERNLGDKKLGYVRIKEAMGAGPDELFPAYLHGLMLVEDDKDREAIKIAQGILETDPEYDGAWAILAAAYYGRSQWKKAIAAAERCLALDPENDWALRIRTAALSIVGKTDEAEAASLEELALDAASPHAHISRGYAKLHGGEVRAAAESFREAIRLDPSIDAAREGMKEALRGIFPPYRWVQAFHLFQTRLGNLSWVLIIGIIFGRRLLRDWLATDPPLVQKVLGIAVGTVLFFLIYGWVLLNPIMNAVLRFHPFGRLILSRPEKLQSVYTLTLLGCLALMAMIVATGISTWSMLALPILGVGLLGLTGMVTSNDKLRIFLTHVVGILFVGLCLVFFVRVAIGPPLATH